jgi:hypothetical protein
MQSTTLLEYFVVRSVLLLHGFWMHMNLKPEATGTGIVTPGVTFILQ